MLYCALWGMQPNSVDIYLEVWIQWSGLPVNLHTGWTAALVLTNVSCVEFLLLDPDDFLHFQWKVYPPPRLQWAVAGAQIQSHTRHSSMDFSSFFWLLVLVSWPSYRIKSSMAIPWFLKYIRRALLEGVKVPGQGLFPLNLMMCQPLLLIQCSSSAFSSTLLHPLCVILPFPIQRGNRQVFIYLICIPPLFPRPNIPNIYPSPPHTLFL